MAAVTMMKHPAGMDVDDIAANLHRNVRNDGGRAAPVVVRGPGDVNPEVLFQEPLERDKSVWGNWRGFTVDGGAIWFDDISPPGTNDDPKAPDFWKKGKFLIITVNNESYYDCKAAR